MVAGRYPRLDLRGERADGCEHALAVTEWDAGLFEIHL
jgi:hypothetical protein